MSPTYKMPDAATGRRLAILGEIDGALAAARCATELAGVATDEFVVRELLLAVIAQIDRASSAVRRLA